LDILLLVLASVAGYLLLGALTLRLVERLKPNALRETVLVGTTYVVTAECGFDYPIVAFTFLGWPIVWVLVIYEGVMRFPAALGRLLTKLL
jgi:hypothetical protein